MAAIDDTQTLYFADAGAWAAWLDRHHATRTSVWVAIAKKGADGPALTRSDALDVALCYGWIDSQARSVDETHYVQRFSPRRRKSPWSRINVAKAEALIAAGRMHEAGLAEVRAAQADGRWDAAYASQRDVTVPPDLAQALERNAAAKEAFNRLGQTLAAIESGPATAVSGTR